jgi:hypothetical protein
VRGEYQRRPHLPGFDEIQDHLRLSSLGFLACMDKDQGGRGGEVGGCRIDAR